MVITSYLFNKYIWLFKIEGNKLLSKTLKYKNVANSIFKIMLKNFLENINFIFKDIDVLFIY